MSVEISPDESHWLRSARSREEAREAQRDEEGRGCRGVGRGERGGEGRKRQGLVPG